MTKTAKWAFAALTITVSAVLLGHFVTRTTAQSPQFNEGQAKEIQKIVKDYLIANPEVLLEVQAAYEEKVEQRRNMAQKERIPEFYKALDGLKSELAAFTVGQGDVTVIEFFDYNCGYCQRALPEVMKLMETDKNVKALFLEYPILSAGSQEAAKAAVAAAKQGKYFEFHREMLASGRASKESALKAAEKTGLDMTKLAADIAAPETEAFLAKLSEIGRRLMVDGTPSFVIGDKLIPGAAEAEQMKILVDETRKQGCQGCVKS
jgi:protein-disulfide isomerase